MVWTQRLYDIEDRAKEMSTEDRRALRQAEALPILARMKARFEEVRPTLRPTAKLAEAIDYVLNRWDAFVRYTSDGRIPIDNKIAGRRRALRRQPGPDYVFILPAAGGRHYIEAAAQRLSGQPVLARYNHRHVRFLCLASSIIAPTALPNANPIIG